MRYIIRDEHNYLKFSINYLIRTMCLLSRVLYNSTFYTHKKYNILIQLDMFYIDNWSFILGKILADTYL